jgi:predicted AAA+ superfamily ATPase
MMRRVSESLAGRAVYLDLWPMNEAEKAGRADAGPWSDWLAAPDASRLQRTIAPARPVADLEKRIRVGGYPVPATTGDRGARTAWFEGYVRTYLERDLQELAAIDSLPDFRRLMRLAALRVGQLVHQTELGRDAGLSQPTVHRWLALLETSFQIVRLAPYAVNRTKRLVKTPKLYWSDTGLAAHLAGEEAPVSGALVENLVLAQLLVWRETVTPRPEILFWRTHTGDEVDLVIEAGPRLLPIEVKSGRRASLDDAKGLEAFLDEYPRAARFGIVLYNGGEVLRLTERIVAAPLAAIW